MTAAPEHATEVTRAQFGAVAETYATSTYHASGPDLQVLVNAASPAPSDHVLDLGCGAGHTALAIAPHVAHVTAVDVTPDMLKTAARLAQQRGVSNISFHLADAANLPFPESHFDLVTSRVAAHHFADPPAAIAEIRRVLKPGGRLVIVDSISPEEPQLETFVNCIEVLRDASHVRDWRVSDWLRMLQAGGFPDARLVERFSLRLDGDEWVKRMRTPASKVAMIRQLFAEATAAQQAAFEIQTGEEKWGFTLGLALLRGTRSQ